jgi:hypothetical protein
MTTAATERRRNRRWDFSIFLLLGIYLLLVTPLERLYERRIMPRPFISAAVEILPGVFAPRISYDADAVIDMRGQWVATIYTADGLRLGSRRGKGSYSAREDGPRVWGWEAFFESTFLPPAVPSKPFKVCVRYVAETDLGVVDYTPEFCSEIFDPREVTE